jgi:fatty acid desaturase
MIIPKYNIEVLKTIRDNILLNVLMIQLTLVFGLFYWAFGHAYSWYGCWGCGVFWVIHFWMKFVDSYRHRDEEADRRRNKLFKTQRDREKTQEAFGYIGFAALACAFTFLTFMMVFGGVIISLLSLLW